MAHGHFAALIALGLSMAACTGEVQTLPSLTTSGDEPGGANAAGAGGGAGAGGAATAGADAGGAPSEALLEGHYMQQFIGNCINAEEWLTLGPASSFTHTLVDRSFCGPHSVSAVPGAASSDGQALELAWNPEGGEELRRFTYARVDPYPTAPPVPPPDGYMRGTAALNRTGYARSGDAPHWHRDDRRMSRSPQGSLYDVTVSIDVSLDAWIPVPQAPTACSMTVSISVAVLTAEADPPALAAETFSLPCTYAHDEALPWIRITADGFEQSSIDSSWLDYLAEKGFWNKYPSLVTNPFYDAFRPVLFYTPGGDGRLFHDVSFAWYVEMKSPPPASVD